MLLLAAAPMASDWVNGARTRESRSKLEQAYGMAKALATRNPCGARNSGSESSALTVALEGTQTTVTVTLPGDSSSCSFLASHPNPQWTALLPPGVAISIHKAAPEEGKAVKLTLDNRGIAGSETDYLITKGGKGNDEEGQLH